MPSKKQPTVPEWQVILEDIQSQNRATIEAVEAARVALEQRIDRVDEDSRGRDAVLGIAIRDIGKEVRELKSVVQENSVDIRAVKAGLQEQTAEIGGVKAGLQEHSAEIRGLKAGLQEQSAEIRGLRAGLQEQTGEIRTLSDKVEAMVRIEERVTALEQRPD